MTPATLIKIDAAIKSKGGFITVNTRAVCAILKENGALIGARSNGKLNAGETPIFKIAEGGQTISSMNYTKQRKKHEPDFEPKESWHVRVSDSIVTDRRTESKLYLASVFDSSHNLARPKVHFEYKDGTKLDSDLAAQVKEKIAKKDSNPTPFRVYKAETLTRVAVGGEIFTNAA